MYAVGSFHQHPARHGKGAVQPGVHQHTTVLFGSHAGISTLQFAVFLDLEGGAVAVAGAQQEALGRAFRDTEGDDGAAAAAEVILTAGNQIPGILFLQPAVALLL